MEDKKKTDQPQEQIEKKPDTTPVTTETTTAATLTPPVTKKKVSPFTYIAVALVIFALVAVWFRLEKEERVSTNFFSSIIANQEANQVVATVNDATLRNSDLELSIEQLTQAATLQGVDPSDPAVQTEIRTQATEMLVNTTLLKQAAAEAGINITDEQIAERITELETDAGGPEVMQQRMDEFGIDRETFEADVESELTILALLDTVFAESDVSVSDEEVTQLYESAGVSGAELPPLEAVRPQIEAQIRQSKEQAAVDTYLDELRAGADIDIAS